MSPVSVGGAIHHIGNVHKYAREFLLLGANIDAARFGIAPERAVNYHADHQGTGVVYDAVSESVCNFQAPGHELERTH